MLIFLPFVIGSSALAVSEVWQRRGLRPNAKPKSAPVAKPEGRSSVKQSCATDLTNQSRLQKVSDWLEPKSESEAELVQELKLTSAGLCVATAGVWIFPLQLAGVVFLVPTISRIVRSAYRHLRYERRVTGDVLATVLTAGAYAGGFFLAINLAAVFFVLMRWLGIKTESHAREGIADLFGQNVRSAWVIVGGIEVEIPLEQVKVGDSIVVHGGQIIPTDGTVVEGNATVIQHVLTGEWQPAEKQPGDPVFAATVVSSGRISIRVDRAGEDTAAAQIARMLADTSDYSSTLARRADRFNDRVALPFIVLGAVSLPFVGLNRALTILMASPGPRMMIYGPLSMLSYLRLASQAGILIKDGRALESLHDVDTVIFDKTGTLTMEQPCVARLVPCPGFSGETVLTLAAAAEARQTHPIARSVLNAAEALGIQPPPIDEASYVAGHGIEARVNGRALRVGSLRYMETEEIVVPDMIRTAEREAHDEGHSLVLVAIDGVLAGGIVLQPSIRKEAAAVIKSLRTHGMKIFVMSGDREAPTLHLAKELGVDGYFSEVLPAQKANLVKGLQAQGRKVCFVGDGINDSIALKSANVSISLSGATAIAVDTAQIVLMDGTLKLLPRSFELSREFRQNMRINVLVTTVPNVVILGGALFFGLRLLTATAICQISLPFALYNTLRPLLGRTRQVTGDEASLSAE